MIRLFGMALLWSAVVASAAAQDKARQWVITPTVEDAGAYRLTLTEPLYRNAQRSDLGDISVLNGADERVPLMIGPAQVATQEASQLVERWFVMLAAQKGGPLTPPSMNGQSVLIDLETASAPLSAVELAWSDTEAVDTVFSAEGSDDLQHWTMLQPHAPILDLKQGEERLQQRRITLESSSPYRYLRSKALADRAAPHITGINVVMRRPVAARQYVWMTLEGRAVTESGRRYFDYWLPARIPVTQVDVQTPGSSTAHWTLFSRERQQAPWQWQVGPWLAFSQQDSGQNTRSQPQVLMDTARDRWWRLASDTPTDEPPRLLLGYAPETLTYLAQGKAPYRLVTGDQAAVRNSALIVPVLTALRQAHGATWQPSMATLAEQSMPSTDALPDVAPSEVTEATPSVPSAMSSRRWVLWGVLLAGCAVVVVLAFSILRTALK